MCCVLPETFDHVGHIHRVGNSVRLPIVDGLQLLCKQHWINLRCMKIFKLRNHLLLYGFHFLWFICSYLNS